MLLSLIDLRLDTNFITSTIPTELCELDETDIFHDEDEISCTCIDSIYVKGTTYSL